MKKLLAITGVFVVFLFIYFLQSNFFTWYNIFGVKPNLFIILALVSGLFLGKTRGGILSIIIGLLLDFFIGKNLGLNAISLGLVGLLGGVLDKNFSKDKRISLLLMAVSATFSGETIIYFMKVFINKTEIEMAIFIKIVLIEMLFNALLVVILYSLIQKAGEKIENIFKERYLGEFR